jgi:hypothetical protein
MSRRHRDLAAARFGSGRGRSAICGTTRWHPQSRKPWRTGLANDTGSTGIVRARMTAGHLDRSLWFVKARPDRAESCELLPHRYWTESA